ncbi:MAG TPA: 6-phosphogluconolactonase [Thermomicrobiales bacterium]|nr:6-phosphogluconolactonase [Thermomicrobiales bacterium]
MSAPDIQVSPDPTALAEEAARRFVVLAGDAIAARGRFTVALSGGSTPRALFRLLAAPPHRDAVDWARVQVGWGDERCVPPDDEQSNYRMARETLLAHVPIPEGQIHRIPAELPDHEVAADAYAATLREVFAPPPGAWPRFDLLYLGLGPEGHTASLFPDSPALDERARLVAAPYVEKLHAHRVTLTPPVINAARVVTFLVAGADKAAIVREVLRGPRDVHRLPAQVVAPADGALVWLLDTAAATEVRSEK